MAIPVLLRVLSTAGRRSATKGTMRNSLKRAGSKDNRKLIKKASEVNQQEQEEKEEKGKTKAKKISSKQNLVDKYKENRIINKEIKTEDVQAKQNTKAQKVADKESKKETTNKQKEIQKLINAKTKGKRLSESRGFNGYGGLEDKLEEAKLILAEMEKPSKKGFLSKLVEGDLQFNPLSNSFKGKNFTIADMLKKRAAKKDRKRAKSSGYKAIIQEAEKTIQDYNDAKVEEQAERDELNRQRDKEKQEAQSFKEFTANMMKFVGGSAIAVQEEQALSIKRLEDTVFKNGSTDTPDTPDTLGNSKGQDELNIKSNSDTETVSKINENNEKIVAYLYSKGETEVADYIIQRLSDLKKPSNNASDNMERETDLTSLTLVNSEIAESLKKITEAMRDKQDIDIERDVPLSEIVAGDDEVDEAEKEPVSFLAQLLKMLFGAALMGLLLMGSLVAISITLLKKGMTWLKETLVGWATSISNGVVAAWGYVRDKAIAAATAVAEWTKSAFNTFLSVTWDPLYKAWTHFYETIKPTLDVIVAWWQRFKDDPWGTITDMAGGVADFAADAAKKVNDTVKAGKDYVAGKASSAWAGFKDLIGIESKEKTSDTIINNTVTTLSTNTNLIEMVQRTDNEVLILQNQFNEFQSRDIDRILEVKEYMVSLKPLLKEIKQIPMLGDALKTATKAYKSVSAFKPVDRVFGIMPEDLGRISEMLSTGIHASGQFIWAIPSDNKVRAGFLKNRVEGMAQTMGSSSNPEYVGSQSASSSNGTDGSEGADGVGSDSSGDSSGVSSGVFGDVINTITGAKSDGFGLGDLVQTKGTTNYYNANEVGSISGKYESGTRGVATVSTGKDDPGGVSYGKFQLASKTGTMAAFLRSGEGKEYGRRLAGLRPGSHQFSQKYITIVNNDAEGFHKAQHAFIERTHYNPVKNYANSKGIDTSSKALQEALWSQSVQHGLNGNKVIINNAVASGVDDEEALIKSIYQSRANYVGKLSLSGNVKQSLMNRYSSESSDVLALASLSNNADSAGTSSSSSGNIPGNTGNAGNAGNTSETDNVKDSKDVKVTNQTVVANRGSKPNIEMALSDVQEVTNQAITDTTILQKTVQQLQQQQTQVQPVVVSNEQKENSEFQLFALKNEEIV